MSLTLSYVLLALTTSLIVYLILVLRARKPHEPYPVVGHLPAYLGKSAFEIYDSNLQASRSNGWKSFPVYLPGAYNGWFVCDPAVIVLIQSRSALSSISWSTSNRAARASRFSDCCQDVLGTGLFNANGDHWRAQRGAGLIFAKPKTLAYVANTTLPRHLPMLFNPLDMAAQHGGIVDFEQTAFDFTLAHFGDIAFDADGAELVRVLSHPFDNAISQISMRVANPFFPILEAVLPYGKKLRADIKLVHDYTRVFVREAAERIRDAEYDEKDGEDEQRGLLIRGLLKTGMSEDDVADSCLNYVLAGRDTTAHAMTWTLYLLLRNPGHLPRIHDEIRAIPSSSSNTDLGPHLRYLDACISETMRIYPPVPLGMYDNVSPNAIPLPDGAIVQPGEKIMYSAWVSGRDPAIWGPGDLEAFAPERWLKMDQKPSAYEWPVFNAGPRSCLGQQMARTEVLIAMREVMSRYEFSLGWDRKERFPTRGLTLPMTGGLPVRVARR